MNGPAIFFDRDGTLIQDKYYLSDPAGIEFFPGTIAALKMASAAGYQLVVVSNQSGVSRGLMKEAEVQAVNDRIRSLLREQGIELAGIYYCPHHPDFDGTCTCRKPGRGMVDQALADRVIDLENSYVVGDSKVDIELGFNIGAGTVLVTTGFGADQLRLFGDDRKPDYVAEEILAAVMWIVKHDRG